MALNLIGPAGLFTRLGHLIYSVNHVVNFYRGTELPNRVDVIQGDYADADQNLIDGLYSQLASAQASHTSMINYWRNLAQATVTQMVNANQPQLLTNYQNALLYLHDYLIATSQTVTRNTVSATITPAGGNQGNGVVVLSPYTNTGLPLEQMFQEDVILQVTRDARGGATAGQETLQMSGTHGTTDMLSWAWPEGSNALANLTAITPKTSGSTAGKNWLTNGTMEAFTSNVPTGWHIDVGSPGTSVLQSATDYYDGSSSLRFVGDGSELTAIRTQFGVDFAGKALDNDQLAVNLSYRVGGTPTTGVLVIALTDNAGVVLLDGAGAPAAISLSLVGGDALWHTMSGFLRMPTLVPSTVYLTISLSTALTAAATLNLDGISLARPTLFYPGGPQVACFSGSTDWAVGDTYAIVTQNAFNGLMQSGCNQLLNLSQFGLILPSTTGTATLPDTLVS